MMTFQTTRWSALLTTFPLIFATVVYAGKPQSTQDHSDFGASPDSFVGRLEPTSSEAPTLRQKLIRKGLLDDLSTEKDRTSSTLKTKPAQVEDVPTLPKAPADSGTPTKDNRPPHKQPTIAEKIQHRYSDPRVTRMLDRLTAQSSVSLYVEVAQMIDTRHIQPTTYARRVDCAFEHLLLALKSSAFCKAANLQADSQSVSRLEDSLAAMRQKTTARNLDDAVNTLNQVQDLFDRTVRIQSGAVGLEFVHAELDTLDQFSSLIPPEKAGGPSVGLRDSLVGIGVEVEPHADGLKVLKVLSGGPAADVQIRRGDILTGADGHSLKGLELNQAVDHILGQPGTSLELQLARGTRKGDVTLIRRRIPIHAVASRMMDDKNKVGYIKLETFSESCVQELDQALMSLHNDGMKSLVLDLRGNPGGLLTAAISISDRFLPSGTIVSTKGRTAADNSQEEAHFAETWKVPLVVLIDRNSASASEILAAAIQENGRGIIIGERSYGKGTVQTLFALNSAPAGVRLTTAKFYSPEGREMAGAGVTPDLKVDPTIGDDAENDAAIAAALKLTADPRLKEMASRVIKTGAAPRVFRATT